MNDRNSGTPEPFQSPWWCRGPHCQTLWSSLFRRQQQPPLIRETFELPDGDFVELDWLITDNTGPIVVILHGLEGSSNSHYIKGLLNHIHQEGQHRAVVLHSRACGGNPNRKPHSYHAGQTEDLDVFIKHLQQRYTETEVMLVGYSLGGNMLLKWLGTHTIPKHIARAVAVSVPYELAPVTDRLNRGFSRLYQWYLLRMMKRAYHRKRELMEVPIDTPIDKIRTVRQFDDVVVAPLNGFKDADDYYNQSSCRQYLAGIKIPTLLIHALDDPFMVPVIVPDPKELNDNICLVRSTNGGHVGFINGSLPWAANYWLEQYILQYLT